MEYLKEIIFTAIICGTMSGLAALRKNGNDNFVKFVCSLAFLYVLLSPFIDNSDLSLFITDGLKRIAITDSTISDTDYSINGMKTISEEICKAVIKNAAEEFSVPDNNFSIKLIYNNEKEQPEINEVKVYTYNQANYIDTAILKKHFANIFECPVEVINNEETTVNH